MKTQKRSLILLLLVPVFLLAGKLDFQKVQLNKHHQQKVHELEKHFGITPQRAERNMLRRGNENRLLVMLVDFVEDNDSSTTGNGKFLFSDPDYPIDLGKPPHDQEYFWWVMKSVKYYYDAASLGAYDLQYDVFPQVEYSPADTAVVAYTLPQKMSYYNPVAADTDLMISRFEEYFHDVFSVVDQDSTVDFSRYGHYMIIHAGSDSQHDIMGNSQSDIPSFFINVGDGKEVIVDDGIVIDYACNVPETISQDGQYGVTTAVTAHEFGHSLGFVDLYSTLTGGSQVGWFDIMDSGGMGELIVAEVDGEVISIEGGLPTLPNAWHRILVWEDYFRQHGYLLDIDELNWQESIRVEPAEKLTSNFNSPHPYFIKIPLTEKEYLLVENRQVDPDGDSGLSFKGGLPQYPSGLDKGYRVLLYPTYPAPDPRDEPNWEYDLFIPGWQGEGSDGRTYNYGGGLLIWHIDDQIIYEDGDWIDGEFYSNYDQNTVNALHSARGVKVVEADGFDNIGNYNDSYNMLGSAYDTFYKYYPLLNEDGSFLGWDDSGMIPGHIATNDDDFIHTVEFNGNTVPQLATNDGEPFMFGLWNISSYSLNVNDQRYMTFTYGSHLWDQIQTLADYNQITHISPVNQDFLSFPGFLTFADDNVVLQTLIGETWDNHLAWEMPFAGIPSQPVVVNNLPDSDYDAFQIVQDSLLISINGYEPTYREFNSNFVDAPMSIEKNDQLFSIYPLADRLVINNTEMMDINGVLSYDGQYLISAAPDHIWFIDPQEKSVVSEYDLPLSDYQFYPTVFKSEIDDSVQRFIISDHGCIWNLQLTGAQLIFDFSDFTDDPPSQLLLTTLEKDGRTWLTFAAGEYLFAITDQGTLAQGFPRLLENRSIKPASWLQSFLISNEVLLLLQQENSSQIAVNYAGDIKIDMSAIQPGSGSSQKYWYDPVLEELNWFGSNGQGRLLRGSKIELPENPALNLGFRNQKYNLFTGNMTAVADSLQGFRAYAFPNPVQDQHATLRVFEADHQIDFTLYDIAGNSILSGKEDLENNPYQDLFLDLSHLSSGVYYIRIKSGNNSLTVPVGIQK